MWARYCLGTTEAGDPIAANDPNWETLADTARRAVDTPGAWLAMRTVYGNLEADSGFASAFALWLKRIHEDGVDAALSAHIDGKTTEKVE